MVRPRVSPSVSFAKLMTWVLGYFSCPTLCDVSAGLPEFSVTSEGLRALSPEKIRRIWAEIFGPPSENSIPARVLESVPLRREVILHDVETRPSNAIFREKDESSEP